MAERLLSPVKMNQADDVFNRNNGAANGGVMLSHPGAVVDSNYNTVIGGGQGHTNGTKGSPGLDAKHAHFNGNNANNGGGLPHERGLNKFVDGSPRNKALKEYLREANVGGSDGYGYSKDTAMYSSDDDGDIKHFPRMNKNLAKKLVNAHPQAGQGANLPTVAWYRANAGR